MKQDLNNIVRTVRCAYIAFQNEHDISHKFKFRHLGATSTIYKSSEERPDLLHCPTFKMGNPFREKLI